MKKHLHRILSLLCVLALVFGTVSVLAEEETEARIITVKWEDGDNYDKIRPDHVNASLAGQEAKPTPTEDNGWTGEVTVPVGTGNDWTFDKPEGYTATLSPAKDGITVLTFYHAVAPTITRTGKVSWDDDNNAKKARPESVWLSLLADGEPYGEPKELKGSGLEWAWTWENLPAFKPNSDTPIRYSVKLLQDPAGYTVSAVSDLELKNTLQTGKLSLNAAVSAPEGTDLSSLNLIVEGPDPSMPVYLSWDKLSGGSYDFGEVLPGAYLVRGSNIDGLAEGYTMDPDNSKVADAVYVKPDQSVSLSYKYTFKLPDAAKEEEEEYDPMAGIGALTFRILGPDNRMPLEVTYAQFTDGKYELPDLAPGIYTVAELNAEGLVKYYTLTGESLTALMLEVSPEGTATAKLFNQYKPAPTPEPDAEFVDIPVTKTWNDSNNRDANRPDSITVRLYADGVEVDSHVLTSEENWAFTFVEKPRYQEDGKTEIVYTVNEDDVEMYVKEIIGYNLVNTYLPETTSKSVAKVWIDKNNEQKLRPASIVMTLIMKLPSGGEKTAAIVTLNAENDWTATVDNLPTVVNNEKAEYVWKEQDVLSYTLDHIEDDGKTCIFHNRIFERPEEPEKGTKPRTPGGSVVTLDEYDTPLGVEVIINHVGDCFD